MTLSAYISHKKTQETFMGGEREERKEEIIKKRKTKWKKKRKGGKGMEGGRKRGKEREKS